MNTVPEAKKAKSKLKNGSVETKGRADHIDHLVSKRLKMRRMILGLSQQELGEAVGVSIQQVQKYEKAVNRISSSRLFSFAKILKVTVSYFFNQIEENNAGLNNFFAEEAEEYNASKNAKNEKDTNSNEISEREIISLVRVFSEIKSPLLRKKFSELIKAIVQKP